ncbi:hypothetical protein PAL15_002398 [Salmonella enterica]|nr:hypothetical protein [Salmonella enterica]
MKIVKDITFYINVAAFADKYGTEKAATEYNISVGEVEAIGELARAFHNSTCDITRGENQKMH